MNEEQERKERLAARTGRAIRSNHTGAIRVDAGWWRMQKIQITRNRAKLMRETPRSMGFRLLRVRLGLQLKCGTQYSSSVINHARQMVNRLSGTDPRAKWEVAYREMRRMRNPQYAALTVKERIALRPKL